MRSVRFRSSFCDATLCNDNETIYTPITPQINERAERFFDGLDEDLRNFIVQNLDKRKHSENEVRALVQFFPDVLLYEDEDGDLPIQRGTWDGCYNLSFIPLFAEEGAKHNVGGKGMRGGLLNKYGEHEVHILKYHPLCSS